MAGTIDINFARLRGFVALPLAGFSGRKAEELVESERKKYSQYLDVVLDRRGSVYHGVVRSLERTALHFYHENLVQMVKLPSLYVAGARMADAKRDPVQPWKGEVQMRIWGRDNSIVECQLKEIRLGKWNVAPVWNRKKILKLDLNEISLVQIMGGRVQYLSQLTPVRFTEDTILAPPQPFKMDRSCQGDAISIAGKRYPWGIGVHADSELVFDLQGRFDEFRADVGIATRMGKRGSVIFTVSRVDKKGGKDVDTVLFKSPVVRGSDPKPREVSAKVKGIRLLKLKVENAGDLDLGDVANWGSARVIR
jgi:hypothetical protein